ncbi:hypothetical protein Syn7502_01763 [Synechococcus sp. PCC 7502]|uniref:hypothetical protein n=1 Tax=Synechococcus sp. PCC 7502 TaxID=1173263 RepID=UPI00029FD1F2|nr:hypothetical protein [Synechococcus sp. PCC 7502]AFY73808.1 hypothetical protein Syn7502_01763 [Synechococcus sp. PCC 7502]
MKTKFNFSQVLINWFKGIWNKFNRWLMRRLRPKQGLRGSGISTATHNTPLSGVAQFRHPESLTVQELLAKVQWQLPKQANKTVSTVREEINWD